MEFQHRIIRPDGEVRYFQQIAETSRDDQGRPVRESGTIQDITRQKLAEEALRQSEQRHLNMLMLSPDSHFALVDSRLTFVNRAFCALMGANCRRNCSAGRRWSSCIPIFTRRCARGSDWAPPTRPGRRRG